MLDQNRLKQEASLMHRRRCVRMGRVHCVFFLVAVVAGSCVPRSGSAEDLGPELKNIPFKIVFETHRDGNWELYQVNADGSQPTNLTRTAQVNELYPHVSPDGTKVSLCRRRGRRAAKSRNVYVMNLDGTGRELVGRQCAASPCWNPDGTAIVYAHG